MPTSQLAKPVMNLNMITISFAVSATSMQTKLQSSLHITSITFLLQSISAVVRFKGIEGSRR